MDIATFTTVTEFEVRLEVRGYVLISAVERRSESADSGRVDDGRTNSVSFDTICLAVERLSEPSTALCLAVERLSETSTADGLTTDRHTQFFFNESFWPSSAVCDGGCQ